LVRIWFQEPGVNARVPLSIPDAQDLESLSSFDLVLGPARVRIVALPAASLRAQRCSRL